MCRYFIQLNLYSFPPRKLCGEIETALLTLFYLIPTTKRRYLAFILAADVRPIKKNAVYQTIFLGVRYTAIRQTPLLHFFSFSTARSHQRKYNEYELLEEKKNDIQPQFLPRQTALFFTPLSVCLKLGFISASVSSEAQSIIHSNL